MLIRYADGSVRAGILLSLAGEQMRVALQDADDVAEFRLMSGRWVSEECETVTFEFPLAAFQAAGILPEAEQPALPPVGAEEADHLPATLRLN